MRDQDYLSEQDFAEMYNLGYGLNKISPELAELIVQVKTKSPQLDALKAGIEKANEPDKDLNYLPDWLKEDWFKDTGKDISDSKQRDLYRE